MMKKDIIFGKIKGNATGDHVSIPVYMSAGKTAAGVQMVKPLRIGFNSPHVIQKPTQWEKVEKGKKKSAKPAPIDPNKTWTSNVPVNFESRRDMLNTEALSVLKKVGLKEVMKKELWEAMEKDFMCPESEEDMNAKFRSPVVDDPFEGNSQFRIKFAFNGFNKQKRFALYDCRLSKKEKIAALEKKGKSKSSKKAVSSSTAFPLVMPGAIRDGNAVAGTAQVVSGKLILLFSSSYVLSFIGRKNEFIEGYLI